MTERFYAWEDAVELAKQDPNYIFSKTEEPPIKTSVEYIGPDEDDQRDTSADDLQWDENVWVEDDEGKKTEPRGA